MENQQKDEFLSCLKSEYMAKGVVLSIKRSKEKRVVLKCDRGGNYSTKYRDRVNRAVRNSNTRLNGCPFEIVSSSVKGVWAVRKITDSHNHPVEINDLAGHSIARRLPQDQKQRIHSLGESGIAPKDILSVLRAEFPKSNTVSGDIYNELSHFKNQILNGRQPIEALVECISNSDYESSVRMKGNTVECVFFAHKNGIELARRFYTTFLIDCTYKTNKFGMPLLNIVGITSTNSTFNVAFAFLSSEDEASYTWALKNFAKIVNPKIICTDRELALMNSIKQVFPSARNMLCIWHINKVFGT
jgi:hypothetical protein